MANDGRRWTTEVPADRREPIGGPTVRGDPIVAGDRVREAVGFDFTDPDSLTEAARTIRSSSEFTVDDDDHVSMLCEAAAYAVLIRGVGSYKRAAECTGGDVPVLFTREWARIHDLLQSVHQHAARGRTAPTAAKYIARTSGDTRLHLTWVTLDVGLTVCRARRFVNEINDGTPAADALANYGVDTGRFDVTLPADVYLELRRRALLEDTPPGGVAADALDDYLG